VIAVLSNRLRIPYAVALVIGGLALGLGHRFTIVSTLTGGQRPNWLTSEVILILFLPPLLFEGSIKIRTHYLRENLVPLLVLANVGVIVATLITGLAIHWVIGLPIMTGLLFGCIISPTDPISVLSVFKEMGIGKRLSMIVEGESLFNDGTAVALFGILLAGIHSGHLGVAKGTAQFVGVVLGSAAFGSLFGYVVSKITQRIDEPTIEITLTAILAYGSYIAAQSLHLSGVIAAVAAGIVLGNFGVSVGMSPRTQMAMWSFWEYAAFVINSLLFLLIGMQVRLIDLLHERRGVGLAIGAVLLGRILSVYGLTPLGNLVSERIPLRWQHVLVWGGLRGALALALVLSLDPALPYRSHLLTWTFGVVAFSLIVQGLTIKPLLRLLGIRGGAENAYDRARTRQSALSSARRELDDLLRTDTLSRPLHARLRQELDDEIKESDAQMAGLFAQDSTGASGELETARKRLLAAELGAIQGAVHEGAEMFDDAARQIDDLTQRAAGGPPTGRRTSGSSTTE